MILDEIHLLLICKGTKSIENPDDHDQSDSEIDDLKNFISIYDIIWVLTIYVDNVM